MAQLLQRWRLEGPRQLDLTLPLVPPPAAAPPLAEQLAAQLAWTDAVRLAQALALPAQPPTAAEPQAAAARQTARDWADAALERLRAELRAGFEDPLLAEDAARPQALGDLALADALAPWRLHHAQQQRGMAARVNSLRERLRAHLTGCGAALAALAALDTVLEQALAAREAPALAGLAARLFGERATRHHALDAQRWPALLWTDLQQALWAELDFRLQPLLGLREALDDPR